MQVLHSQIIGQGFPVFILHGFLGMSDNWRTLGLRIAEQGFQVHLIDARNHGHSFHSEDFSYELMCQDVVNYAHHHQVENFHLIGHSMGGKTTMLVATTHPNLIKKAVVVDISPRFYPVHHQLIIEGLSSVDFEKLRTRQEVEKQLSNYILDVGVRQFLMKNLYWEQKEKLNYRFNLEALKNNLTEIGKGLPTENQFLGEILFLGGKKSSYIQKDDETLIARHFPQSQIRWIDNAGHWLHAEKPTEFLNEIFSFFN